MDNNIKQKKILITGGHLSPAIAVIEEIKEKKKSWEIVFVGRTKTSYKNTTVSEEKTLIEQLGIPFISLHAGRISRFFSLHTIIELCLIPVGFFESLRICIQQKPDCIVSFGGYVGLPVVIAGWLLDIPTLIHEQTHTFGLSNYVASEFANKILLTFPDDKQKHNNRVTVTGLPLRASFFTPPKNASFLIPENKPIVYITGGTTGAVTMNELLFSVIRSLVQDYIIIHQTGEHSYEKAVEIKKDLPSENRESYIPKSYIAASDVSWIMHHASLIIGRSGANTVIETATVQKPAVFIPLPWAGNKEQLRNATWYKSIGGEVKIIDQKTISSEQLEKTIIEMMSQLSKHHVVHQDNIIPAASQAIVEAIASLLV